ncbi:MAG TPA: type II secretion system F family protein, partial [Firmicutes bacterium]|nr:type II secretion system F family protein [Bacillota bacterium]
GVDDVKVFTSTIIQAEQLGLNIGNTLKNQAEQMRRRRRQRVEERAMKVPVKMLIPLVFFIFPTIFIVLLGPALIQIIENFAGI